MDIDKLLQGLAHLEQTLQNEDTVIRSQELAGIKPSHIENRFVVKVTVKIPGVELITEHELYKKFEKSTNRYRKDAAQLHIPAQEHFHIVPGNSTAEIYSVNQDGTAHHRDNKGYVVPKKEASELRKLGVQIPENRILENYELSVLDKEADSFIFYLILNDDVSPEK